MNTNEAIKRKANKILDFIGIRPGDDVERGTYLKDRHYAKWREFILFSLICEGQNWIHVRAKMYMCITTNKKTLNQMFDSLEAWGVIYPLHYNSPIRFKEDIFKDHIVVKETVLEEKPKNKFTKVLNKE